MQIIFDIEATCWQSKYNKYLSVQTECIEIGAVKIDEEWNVVDVFHRFVKPLMHPTLSDFCKTLTGLLQHHIDTANTFPVVISEFQTWAGAASTFLSWGTADKQFVVSDCVKHELDADWMLNSHEDIIGRYRRHKGVKSHRLSTGLVSVLGDFGENFNGPQHCAFFDAYNAFRIMKLIGHDTIKHSYANQKEQERIIRMDEREFAGIEEVVE